MTPNLASLLLKDPEAQIQKSPSPGRIGIKNPTPVPSRNGGCPLTYSQGWQVLLQGLGIRKSALEKVTLLQEHMEHSLVTLHQQGGLQKTPTE